MKAVFFMVAFWVAGFTGKAQDRKTPDSLKTMLVQAEQDSSRVLLLNTIGHNYAGSSTDSCRFYTDQALALARKIHFSKGEALSLIGLGWLSRIQGDIPQAFNFYAEGQGIAAANHHLWEDALSLSGLAAIFMDLQDLPKAGEYFDRMEKICTANELKTQSMPYDLFLEKARYYQKTGRLDSAQLYLQKSDSAFAPKRSTSETACYLLEKGNIQFKAGNHAGALESLRQGLLQSGLNSNFLLTAWTSTAAAGFFRQLYQPDSAIVYAEKGFAAAMKMDYKPGILRASSMLAELYDHKDSDTALKYYKVAKYANDHLYGPQKVMGLQKIIINEQDRQQKFEAAQRANQTRLKWYSVIAGFGLTLIFGLILFRTKRHLRK
ncbi:tetratricopeptide repeat protein [Flavihumibacter fluvii]|uniref:tetratricopeptide repeat protein n=1 Tax=Flavihumibacter fluvii TaxID=2838157 RepID=UPI001BDE118B|nr:hypothetical protein [Flavihumibacter fluvii]ULQ51016.1 hypothetical protein KJS93_13075 [Flavihumibacter fluvii]